MKKDFLLELQDLSGLTFTFWCVGGDFNVIRRILEEMGVSRLTLSMRIFISSKEKVSQLIPLLEMHLLLGQIYKR